MKSKKKVRVACIQVNAKEDWRENFVSIYRQVKKAVLIGAHIIALPEACCWRGADSQMSKITSETTPFLLNDFRGLAKKNKVAILLGSILEPNRTHPKKFYNTSWLISERGRIVARYRKIHLFTIRLKQTKAQESQSISSGSEIVTGKVAGVLTGLSICYDLRFPELYRKLVSLGARILFVPANFTEWTGKAHWEVLLRARAIENQVFIVAPAQVGTHPKKKIRSYGHSLIVDPWGQILAEGSGEAEDVVWADLDLAYQDQIRKGLPVLRDRYFK